MYLEAHLKAKAEIFERKQLGTYYADKPGVYTGFSGEINYKGNSGEVVQATFTIKEDGMIFFDNGGWMNGVWHKVTLGRGGVMTDNVVSRDGVPVVELLGWK